MPKLPVTRSGYQRAPHASTPRRDAWEGLVLVVVGMLCAVLALEALIR